MLLVGGCFRDRADRSLNLLTRRLTRVYPEQDSVRETVENLEAAGFLRVRRPRIKGLGQLVIAHKGPSSDSQERVKDWRRDRP